MQARGPEIGGLSHGGRGSRGRGRDPPPRRAQEKREPDAEESRPEDRLEERWRGTVADQTVEDIADSRVIGKGATDVPQCHRAARKHSEALQVLDRSEERRVGKESRSR